jgi:hypothetical protein
MKSDIPNYGYYEIDCQSEEDNLDQTDMVPEIDDQNDIHQDQILEEDNYDSANVESESIDQHPEELDVLNASDNIESLD